MAQSRTAVTYPLSSQAVGDWSVRESSRDVGLAHFLDRLDDDVCWDQVLSGGEKQRLGFARMMLQRPRTIVMDEATAALDPATRKLVLAQEDGGGGLVGDELLHAVRSTRITPVRALDAAEEFPVYEVEPPRCSVRRARRPRRPR